MSTRHDNWVLAPRRLDEFIRYTQRFRLVIAALGIIWFTVFHLLGLTPESGVEGSWGLGSLIAAEVIFILALPYLAGWRVRHERSVQSFHAILVVVDTLLVCATIPLTGGAVSVTFAFFYFLAVGNCYGFNNREMLLSNTFMSVSYVVTLLLVPEGPYAPKLLDWVDILLVRIPLIYLVSGFAVWVAQCGHRAHAEDQRRYLETLKGLLAALEVRDGYTRQHSLNVARWTAAFARYLSMSEVDVEILVQASELHDIGKIGVPDGILNKPSKLTEPETQRMQEHPVIGVEITRTLRWFSRPHQEIVRHHHERWDGQGYPDRLAGREIPYLARVTALCDVFDALTNHRPYRSGLMMSQAFDLISSGRGSQFDPELTDRFLTFLGELLEFLRLYLPVTNFRCGTWAEDEVLMEVLTPAGTLFVRLRYERTGWVWLGSVEAKVPSDLAATGLGPGASW